MIRSPLGLTPAEEVDEALVNNPPPRLTQPPDAMIGTLLAGKYRIVKKLGEGGMGSVYQAQQLPIERMVAIKLLLGRLAQDEVALKRFEQEARAISRMQHPNTVIIYDYGKTDDDRLYIVMEYLRGKTLSDALRATGGMGLDPKRVVHITKQVCASLSDAHAAGIIHRDLKPDNIFLTEVGHAKDWVKVLDFGVAKMSDNEAGATLTQTGMIFGTPKYMSPEQAEGKPIDHRADIYAIGVVLYEMIAGRPPFIAETPVSLLLKHISEAPPPFSKVRPDLAVRPELEAVVMKTLEKSPERRYPNVEALSADLDACLGLMLTGAVPVATPTPGAMGAQPRGLPTEVNAPATPLATGQALPSPAEVPSNLSLGTPNIRRMPTEPAPPNSTAQVPTALTHHPDPASQATLGTSPGSPTRPIVGAGPGVDTMGAGVPSDLSQPVRTPAASMRLPILGGLGLVVVATAIALVVQLGNNGAAVVDSRPLTALEDPGPKVQPVAAVPEVAPPVAAEPTQASPDPSPLAPKPEDRQKPPRPATKERGRPSAATAKVTVRFTSAPSGAIVEETGGAQLGKTPFSREYVKGSDLVRVTFKLAGYEPHTDQFTIGADRTLSAELKKVAAPLEMKKPVIDEKPVIREVKPNTSLDDRVDDLHE